MKVSTKLISLLGNHPDLRTTLDTEPPPSLKPLRGRPTQVRGRRTNAKPTPEKGGLAWQSRGRRGIKKALPSGTM